MPSLPKFRNRYFLIVVLAESEFLGYLPIRLAIRSGRETWLTLNECYTC